MQNSSLMNSSRFWVIGGDVGLAYHPVQTPEGLYMGEPGPAPCTLDPNLLRAYTWVSLGLHPRP